MHIAELIAFSKVGDLPPRLYPFVEIKGVFENREIKKDTKVVVFKIKWIISICVQILDRL